MPLGHPELYQLIAKNVVSARRLADLTQEKLALKAGVSRATIASIELCRQNVPIHVLFQIAAALEISPSDLLPSLREVPRMASGDIDMKISAELKNKLSNKDFGTLKKYLEQ